MTRTRGFSGFLAMAALAASGSAQTTDPNNSALNGTEVDACGSIVQGTTCPVFSGGGGTWYLADYGHYKIGDSVRVIGTISTDCTTFCTGIDGCIVGNKIYSSDVNPCGVPIPSFPGDAINSACSSLATTTTGLLLVGMWLTWPGRRRTRK